MSRLLVQCTRAFKYFCSFCLFEGITLSINQGDKFALIGENGSGKTTLLQILAGIQSFDEGQIQKAGQLTIGLLPQEVVITDPNISVRKFVLQGSLGDLEYKMSLLENRLDDPVCLAAWADLHEEYEQKGGYQRVPLEEVLHHLKLDLTLELPISHLSSGQRVRAVLAKILIDNPDLMFLDEPTNQLDQEMIDWLEKMLSERKGASIIISHDRKFLDRTCNRLIEIQNGHLSCFGGNYEFYLREKEKLIQRQIKAHEAQKEELKLFTEKLRSLTFSYRSHKAATDNNKLGYNQRGEGHQKSVQRSIENLKAKITEIEKNPIQHPKPTSITGLVFSSTPLPSMQALSFEEVSKSFGEKNVLSSFTNTIHNCERIVITGSNGSGKTTLLAIAAGVLNLDGGTIRRAPTARIAYLDQEVTQLPMEHSPLEYFHSSFNLERENLVKELYKAGLGDCVLLNRPFKFLSTGQRKRLMILSLILSKPNILLLDEPTNHLDFLTLEALEKALLSFEGAILAVSHDITFINKIATGVWRL